MSPLHICIINLYSYLGGHVNTSAGTNEPDDLKAKSMYGATAKFIRGLLPNIFYKSKYCFYYL